MLKKVALLSLLITCIGIITVAYGQDFNELLKMSEAQNTIQKNQTPQSQKKQPQRKNPQKTEEKQDTFSKEKEPEELSSLEKEFDSRSLERSQSYEDISQTVIRPEESISKNSFKKPVTFLQENPEYQENNDPNVQNKNTVGKDKKKSTTENIGIEPIRQFGYDIFNSNYLDSFQTGITPVSNDYILGPGDHLQIRIWGKFDQVIETDVDAQGNIFLPKVGLIPLAGVRFGNINMVIKKALEDIYVNLELSVALTNLRTIKIFVLGYVKHPGAYDVSSLSTVFSALYSAGGPTKTGTLRKIQLKRHGQTYKTIDLYDYLLKGNNKEDPNLKPFDTIFVPAIGDVIKIQGQVKQPAIYEIKSKTNLYEVVNELAGGLGTHSYYKKIHIERIKEHTERVYFDILMTSSNDTKRMLRKTEVYNGDVITIDQINNQIKNGILFVCAVVRNGIFVYKLGLTLTSVFALCDGLKPGHSNKVQVYRYVSDDQRKLLIVDISSNEGQNFTLEPMDIISVMTEVEEKGKEKITINGAIKKPGAYFLMKDMKLSDLIFLAQLENFADLTTAELYRKNKNKHDEVFRLNLATILTDTNSTQNITLQDEDQLSIRINNKLIKVKKVTLSGEFRFPGVYIALENETLSSIIKRAGGYTDKAFLKGALFQRQSISRLESEGNKLILEEEKKRLIFDQNRNDALNKDNQNIYNSAIAFLQEKIDNSNGRLVISLDSKNFEGGKFDLVLEEGDSLYVPETPNSVQIVGGVQLPTSLIYQGSKKASFYIKQAGGYSSYAERGKYFVFRADGSVILNAKTIERGDTIYVPEKIKIKTNWLQTSSLVAQTVFTFLASLKLLGIF